MNVHDSNIVNANLIILRLLKESAIAGGTEAAVLTHISEETGIKLKKVGKRMTEMLIEGLILMKATPVRFELTESGQEYLRDQKEWLRRKEEELRHLMRSSAGSMAMQEFVAVEEKWKNVRTPDKHNIENIKKTASLLHDRVPQLSEGQPKCWVLQDSYDREFAIYRPQVEIAIERNRTALGLVNDFSSVEKRLKDVQIDIAFLENWQKTRGKLMDNEQTSHALNILAYLDMLKQSFGLQFSKEELEELERLRSEFEKNGPILERLTESTHEWEPIERQTVITKPGRIAPPESSLESTPAERTSFVVKRRCKKCLKEELSK